MALTPSGANAGDDASVRSVRYGCIRTRSVSERLSSVALSQMVHEAGAAYDVRIPGREADSAGCVAGEVGHAPRVPEGVGRLHVGEVGERLERSVEVLLGEGFAERRLAGH